MMKGDTLENLLISPVNEILGDHNVDKQMTDSRGDVRFLSGTLVRRLLMVLI